MAIDILIVDDEDDIRKLIKGILEDEGYATRQANGSAKAYEEINARIPDIMILDIWLQGSEHDGLEILKSVKEKAPHLPVIMISGHGTIETAVSAIKMGAYDFIEKPFKSDRLLLMIERALEISALKRENEQLKGRRDTPSVMVGQSSAIQSVRNAIEKVAGANSRVLFTGDSGTGKGIAARILHAQSSRKDKPFIALNCAITPPEQIEEILFGVEGKNSGILEQADGGIVLLDEVGDLPMEAQRKIVRVLQENKVTRMNGQQPIVVDVRVLASTSRDLNKAIAEGDFREDLYYRLNVVSVAIPNLKNRKEDIPDLAQHFAKDYSAQSGQPALSLAQSAILALQGYDWPGNVRQLRNVIEWAMIMGGSEDGITEIERKHLPPEITGDMPTGESRAATIQDYVTYPLREAREAFERDYLEKQLARFGGNISKTAMFVGMERSALHRKLKSLSMGANSAPEEDTSSDENTNIKQAV